MTWVWPGVVVVVTFAMAYSWPADMMTEFGTATMLVCEEARKTVMSDEATVGSPPASAREMITAG